MSTISATSTTETLPAECSRPEDDGKTLFQQGDYKQAREQWQARLQSIRYLIGKHKNGEQIPNVRQYEEMEIATASNLALVNMKLQMWPQVLDYSRFVLSKDALNEKALYRQARALVRSLSLHPLQYELGRLDEANRILVGFKSHDPSVLVLRRQVADALQKQKNFRKRMVRQK